MGTPNWVAWHLQSEDMGSAPRQDDFRSDNTLPSAWYRVVSTSYSGSGFDRGHNCPSADRTSTIAANSSTFYMTNMIPQAPTLNQVPGLVLKIIFVLTWWAPPMKPGFTWVITVMQVE